MMDLEIPQSGLALDIEPLEGYPTQVFTIDLEDDVIESMLACVHNGQEIQLSLLGGIQAFLLDDQELPIADSSDNEDFDVFRSLAPDASSSPQSICILERGKMSALRQPRYLERLKSMAADKSSSSPALGVAKHAKQPSTERFSIISRTKAVDESLEKAMEKLKDDMANKEFEKERNSARLVDAIVRTGKNGKIFGNPMIKETSRVSPGMSSASPLSNSGASSSQERAKRLRVPLIHELAARPLNFSALRARCPAGDEHDFSTALNKVAKFDDGSQKYELAELFWKQLDVFEHNYASDADREAAIERAIKHYDRKRISPSDYVWQKLLPKSKRDKGICLSKIQGRMYPGSATPKPTLQKPEGSGTSLSGDSERDETSSVGSFNAAGGEKMLRSDSQTKKKAAGPENRLKQMISNSKKPVATPREKAVPAGKALSNKVASAKASPKISPIKAASNKTHNAKGTTYKSKEFVTDSDSENDDVPISQSLVKPKVAAAKPAPRPVEKAKKANNKGGETLPTSHRFLARPAMVTAARKAERKMVKKDGLDTVSKRAQLQLAKRVRDDEGDSSSSTAPMSKRARTEERKTLPQGTQPAKRHDFVRREVGGKTVGPMKSSPLAASPATNASDLETKKDARERVRRAQRERERAREQERDREAAVSSSSSTHENDGDSVTSNSSSNDTTVAGAGGKKRKPMDYDEDDRDGHNAKRRRVSPELLEKARKFKAFFQRYKDLHETLAMMKDPPTARVQDLEKMRSEAAKMKAEIHQEAGEPLR